MEIIYLLQSQPVTFIVTALILGLLIGSFLNVVIYRLPVMMHTEWQQQCNELLHPEAVDEESNNKTETFNLNPPRSR